ncbi:hypothetical protein [Pasteurella atlantica]|uniref:hypothetical protein n=1 Tax=Pasteurellaceae TaxID=712 RepID=UPI002756591C|nr:hypothetical protein [Pasteurella atlantica]MDP8099991.1 hypothetical protein [Pasteurella atlantica]MDP8107856.1 hypothetical protein [Pasteurella atlantica]MDP8115858.1 hypothetical protein [Pasteurella atlantica]
MKKTLVLILSTLFLGMSLMYLNKDNSPIQCSDLLKEYANTPQNIADKLHFEGCEVVNGQIELVRATYKIKAQDSESVEDYFAKKYAIPKMQWQECHAGLCVLSTSSYLGVDFPAEKIEKLHKLDKKNLGLGLSFDMSGIYDYLGKTIKQREYIKDFKIEIAITQSP